MDQKSWLWRKKPSEKTTTVVADQPDLLQSAAYEQQIQKLSAEKAELENDVKILNDKLSSALSECDAKNDMAKKQAKMAEEAMAGKEKVEANVVSLKKELHDALQQRAAGEEKITHLDVALRECMQQLRFVREEKEQRIHDAVMKASSEFDKSKAVLEEKLADTSKKLTKLGVENTQLSKALLAKEKVIEDLSKEKAQVEADSNALMMRLESTEKDNVSLRYEVRVLEKELEIRNEEKEFNHRTADASHRQHLESVKKIAKLESECQRLRILVRKRLPGPAALAKMKTEVEVLGRDTADIRRRRSNYSVTDLPADSSVDGFPDSPKKLHFLTEQLCAIQEENKTLKEALNKKTNELQFSRAMYARTASKLSQVESHLDDLSKGPKTLAPSRSDLNSHGPYSMSDMGSDDKVSCAESWASTLISELEHLKHGKQRGSPSNKTGGASDINLMDDFVEMEKLAIVSVESRSPRRLSHDGDATVSPLESSLNRVSSELQSREIIPVLGSISREGNQEFKSKDLTIGKLPNWVQDILKVVFEQNRVTQRKPDEILEDAKVALANLNYMSTVEYQDRRGSSNHPSGLDLPHVGGCISWTPTNKSLVTDSSGGMTDTEALLKDKSNLFQLDIRKSICKIIELIEGITLRYLGDDASETTSKKEGNLSSYKNLEAPSGYMVQLFQWKTSELGVVLRQFVHTCYDLLNGKSNINSFTQELSSALEWIMSHCFSLQDVPGTGDAIRKQFNWDETRSEREANIRMIGKISEMDKLLRSGEHFSCSPIIAASNGHNGYIENNESQSTVRDENKKLKDEVHTVESAKDLEERIESATNKSEPLMNGLHESEKTIKSLQTELETLKGSEPMVGNQIQNHSLMKEDIDTQLTEAKVEQNEAHHKLSSLQVELENRSRCCEELEATCLELQLQHESVTKKETPMHELHQEDRQLRTDWEITAASEKLAECQETILNLGKQLKALALPREAAQLDKVISTPSDTDTTAITNPNDTDSTAIIAANDTGTSAITTTTSSVLTKPMNKLANEKSSLLDRMLAEDSAQLKNPKSSKIKESGNNPGSAFVTNGMIETLEKILDVRRQENDVSINSLAIVPSKKRGGGSLWRKLLWRKKKSMSKKLALPFAP